MSRRQSTHWRRNRATPAPRSGRHPPFATARATLPGVVGQSAAERPARECRAPLVRDRTRVGWNAPGVGIANHTAPSGPTDIAGVSRVGIPALTGSTAAADRPWSSVNRAFQSPSSPRRRMWGSRLSSFQARKQVPCLVVTRAGPVPARGRSVTPPGAMMSWRQVRSLFVLSAVQIRVPSVHATTRVSRINVIAGRPVTPGAGTSDGIPAAGSYQGG